MTIVAIVYLVAVVMFLSIALTREDHTVRAPWSWTLPIAYLAGLLLALHTLS